MKPNEQPREIVILSRDAMAYMVPSGARIILHQGTEVSIVQSLGSTYTLNVFGNLARIEGKDADALGKISYNALENLDLDAPLKDNIMAMLKTVYDPEIPINIVDLGLIYGCTIEPISDQESDVAIEMTLTAPGCGMGPVIAEDARRRVLMIPKVRDVNVSFTFDPPWDRSRMSEVAKLELGMFD